jgi:hypothetical protein
VSRAGVAFEIAERIHRLRYEDLPDEIVAHAKRLILDTLVVARAGGDADGTASLRAMVMAEAGHGESTVWGTGERVPAQSAALVNAYSGPRSISTACTRACIRIRLHLPWRLRSVNAKGQADGTSSRPSSLAAS